MKKNRLARVNSLLKDVIFEVRFRMYDLRGTRYDVRCTIYDVQESINGSRFTNHEVLFPKLFQEI